MTIAVPGGTREVDVPRSLRGLPSLSIDQAREVARLGQRLEATTGWPVDIEFAFVGDRLYLLQCRPITTLDNGFHLESDPILAGRRQTTPTAP
jgi:pyruvate,water dikinase